MKYFIAPNIYISAKHIKINEENNKNIKDFIRFSNHKIISRCCDCFSDTHSQLSVLLLKTPPSSFQKAPRALEYELVLKRKI